MQNNYSKKSSALGEVKLVFNNWLKKLSPIQQGSSNTPNEEKIKSDAVFLAWQKTPKGEVFALYNVIAKQHPLYGSTVTEETLRREHLKVPPTPLLTNRHKMYEFEK